MRGAASLAAALGEPTVVAGGTPFPGRDLIVFLVAAVIFVTIILPGLSLPAVIRRLDLGGGARENEEEVRAARAWRPGGARAH